MKNYALAVVGTLAIALMVTAIAAPSGACATDSFYVSGIEDLLSQGIVTKGTGTHNDPYLIENLIIADSTGDYGLVVENINAYVVIENCEISNVVAQQAQGGLVIRGCSNITVRNCNVYDNELGIRLSHCTDVSLLHNRITRNTLGLRIDLLSRGNTIIGNCFDNDSNAWACCPNVWNNADRGNFWSDLSAGEESGSPVYSISPGNEDHMPATCNQWTVGKQTASPAPEHKEPAAAKPSVEKDTIPPVLKLEGQTELHLAVGKCFTEPGWKATDDRDGDVSGSVVCSGRVDTSRPGTYVLSYVAKDSSGNSTTATRRVVVTDQTPPTITLVGDSEVRVPIGGKFADPGARATDNCDGDLTNKITANSSSSLDGAAPGLYTILYTVEDKAGNKSSIQRRILIGWPEPAKCGGITGTLESLEIKRDPAAATVKLSYQGDSPPDDLQLQVARIVHMLALRIAHFTSARALHLSVTDSGGELAELEVGLSNSEPPNSVSSASDIGLLRSIKILSVRKGSYLDFTQPPQSSQEAEQLIERALDIPGLSEFSVQVRATQITTLEGNVRYSVELSGKLAVSTDGLFESLDKIRDATAMMELLTALAMKGSWREIDVTLSADFYGLLYKNILSDTDALDAAMRGNALSAAGISQYWKEVFVHPVLGMP